ncbi:MAG: phosphoadenosine phosphosulfate reductase family protein [Oscillospiraceae bacterium]
MSLIAFEKTAIARLKNFEPDDGYYLCYSGGKDSDCIKILAHLAGVKFETVHNLTTVDAPETVRYIKSQPDVKIDEPKMSMWKLIEKKRMPPTQLSRFCCEVLKERGGFGKVKVTGVRWAESSSRSTNADLIKIIGKPKTTQKKADSMNADYKVTKQGGLILNNDNDESRRLVEHCYRTTNTMVNPIIDWGDSDVWKFLRHYGCNSNPLYYTTGCQRVGCIGCPMGGAQGMMRDFARYPIYKQNYIKAFDRMIEARKRDGLPVDAQWQDGKHVMAWWLREDINQISFLEDEDE